MFLHTGSESFEVSEHAALRMTQRRVSIDEAESLLSQEPFSYFHGDAWKSGYYDSTSRLSVGTANGRVTTVVTRATPNYINNLKRITP